MRWVSALLFLLLCVPIHSEGQGGLKVVKDRTGSCQISVPANWNESITLVRGSGKVRVFDDATAKMGADKVIENTPNRVFYTLKPNAVSQAVPHVAYQVSVPGNGFHCTAQILVKKGFPVDDVKKIAMTLVPAG